MLRFVIIAKLKIIYILPTKPCLVMYSRGPLNLLFHFWIIHMLVLLIWCTNKNVGSHCVIKVKVTAENLENRKAANFDQSLVTCESRKVATRHLRESTKMAQTGRVVVYGGRGALGSKCISVLKSKNFWVGSIDLNENTEADLNIVLEKDSDLQQQESAVLESIKQALNGNKLDAVICVAGGWAGGNAAKDLIKNSDMMWRQSVWSSLISASVAAQHLKDGGVVTLTGAKAALEGTPGMIGYGMAKSAVHHLTKSLAGANSGLPKESLVAAILPITLDTPMNRKWMPNADFTTWTPLEFIAELFVEWISGKNRPDNGSLLQLVTKNSNTDVIPVAKY